MVFVYNSYALNPFCRDTALDMATHFPFGSAINHAPVTIVAPTIKKLDDFTYFVTWNNPNYTSSSQVEVNISEVTLKCKLSYTVNQNNVNVQVQIQVGNQ